MNEQPALAAPDKPAAEAAPLVEGDRSARPGPITWLYGIGLVILAVAVIYLWQHPGGQVEANKQLLETQAFQQRLDAVDSRVGRLEQQPNPPSAADLGKISARVDALEARLSDQTQLATRLDALSGRIQALSGRDQTSTDATSQQFDRVTGELASLEKSVGGIDAVSARVGRLSRIQAAMLALATGQPLGNVPNAPPALARFADSPPPTEAQLRMEFPQVERLAMSANPSDSSSGPLIDQVWERAEALVTVRRGDRVVVGDASALALNRAQVALEAGDLAGAVAAVSTASPGVRRAAADWIAKAKSLLDARAALADVAART